jgi:HD-like signal output (HDOD) protein
MGLLHDIGKTIMLIKNKDAYPEVQKLVDIGADVLETERTFYGFTHAEVGRALVEKWNLPLMIGITAEHHHNPLGSQEVVGTSIIYVSDRICQEKLKYPIFKQEIIDSLDYEISDPETLLQEVFEMSQLIIDALS